MAHRSLLAEFQATGCVFVTSAVESLSDTTLEALRKGHTRAEVEDVVDFCAGIGLALRPTFVPFTPWDTPADYRTLLRWVEAKGLLDHVDPVQYAIRLLVPPGSLLAGSSAMRPFIGELNASDFTFQWRHPDARMDSLQQRVARIVADHQGTGKDPAHTFFAIRDEADRMGGAPPAARPDDWLRSRFPEHRARPPRLTESWFC